MGNAIRAGTVYVLALFALGFVLGTLRVMFVAPHFGPFVATLMEVPLMMAAAFFICRYVMTKFEVPQGFGARWIMVPCFLVLLGIFETVLGFAVFGQTLSQQWQAVASPAGALGLTAQVITSLFPLLIGRNAMS